MQNRRKAKTKGIIPVSINVYGSSSSADQAGDALAKCSAFLQIPYILEPGCKYFNPQIFRPGGRMQNQTHLVGLTDDDFKAKAISDEVEQIFSSLASPELFAEVDQEISPGMLQLGAIKTQLRRYVRTESSFWDAKPSLWHI
jgi:hypothetical protein